MGFIDLTDDLPSCPISSASATATTTTRTVTSAPATSASATTYPVHNYTVVDPFLVWDLPFDCASIQSSIDSTVSCGYDSVGKDIVGIWAYTFQACVDACNKSKEFAKASGGNITERKALTWAAEMAPIYERLHANCWLKYGISDLVLSDMPKVASVNLPD